MKATLKLKIQLNEQLKVIYLLTYIEIFPTKRMFLLPLRKIKNFAPRTQNSGIFLPLMMTIRIETYLNTGGEVRYNIAVHPQGMR